MKRLTIDAHPMKVPGVWRIRQGNKIVATLVQPHLFVSLSILPTATEVRQAVRELNPLSCSDITDDTPVVWANGCICPNVFIPSYNKE